MLTKLFDSASARPVLIDINLGKPWAIPFPVPAEELLNPAYLCTH